MISSGRSLGPHARLALRLPGVDRGVAECALGQPGPADLEDVGHDRVVGAGLDDAALVDVVGARLLRGHEAGADERAVGAERERRDEAAPVGDHRPRRARARRRPRRRSAGRVRTSARCPCARPSPTPGRSRRPHPRARPPRPRPRSRSDGRPSRPRHARARPTAPASPKPVASTSTPSARIASIVSGGRICRMTLTPIGPSGERADLRGCARRSRRRGRPRRPSCRARPRSSPPLPARPSRSSRCRLRRSAGRSPSTRRTAFADPRRYLLYGAMSFLTTPDGVRLRITDRGSGERTIVLVHGWKLSHRPFEHAILRLARTHRVVAFDLRGMGESDKPNSRYDFDEMADDLEFVPRRARARGRHARGLVDGLLGVAPAHGARRSPRRAAGADQRADQARAHRGRQLPVVDDRGRARGVLLRHGAALALEEREFITDSLYKPGTDLVNVIFAITQQAPLDGLLKIVRAQDEARLPRPPAAHRGPGAGDVRPPRPLLPGRAGGVDRRAVPARRGRRVRGERALPVHRGEGTVRAGALRASPRASSYAGTAARSRIACAVRRARAITVSIGLTPGAVGRAEASPIQTPCGVVQLAVAVGDRRRRHRRPCGTSPSGGLSRPCARRRSPRGARRSASKSSPRRQVWSSQWNVRISSAPRAWCMRASSTWRRAASLRSTGSSSCQRTMGSPSSPSTTCPDAVVVRDRVPGGDIAQAEHPLLVRGAVAERQRAGPERQAHVDRLDEEAAALDDVREVEARERLELPVPGVHDLVVDAAHEVGRVQAEERAGRRPADARAQQHGGRLDAAGRDHDDRRLDVQVDELAVRGARTRGDAGRPAAVGEHAVDDAVDDDRGAGVGRILEVGLERRLLAALLAAGVAVAAERRVVVGRRVARQHLPREPARLEGLGHHHVGAVGLRRLDVDVHAPRDGVEVRVELGAVDAVEAERRPFGPDVRRAAAGRPSS